ncbi:MAG: hypothetical protein HY074_16695 [Deltaproteobacteria bacterium]|nr:hypothetical protein [Deltaproteobacteria bacterium]
MGNELFKEVTDLTGLPKSLISEELVSILGRVGASPHAVTLEDLRKAMATYLTEVIGPNLNIDDEHDAVIQVQPVSTPMSEE